MLSPVGRSGVSLPSGSVLAFRYRLGAPLGRGGAAQAYAAEDLLEHSEVALKLLHPAQPPAELRREFERLRGLAHPHLTRVYDFAITSVGGQRRALYTAQLVRGGDLRGFVHERGFAAALPALGDVLDALHLLHRLGLRHGDVKPENVLVDERGRAVLIDLGCAAPLGQAALTLSGTPGYMAPELSQGLVADERADLFAFGVMLRELAGPLLGAPPAPGQSARVDSSLARPRARFDSLLARPKARFDAKLLARLTAELPRDRPSSAREVLTLLGDPRDVELSTRGRAARCLGREAELAVAEAALLQAARGDSGPRAVWVEGSAGVGRSRFLRELCFSLACAELDLLEAGNVGDAPLRDALARRSGGGAPGFEALLEQLDDEALSTRGSALVLDDAQRLSAEARLELEVVLRSLPRQGRLVALVTSTEPPPALPPAGLLHLKLAPLGSASLAEWSAGVLDGARVAELARFTGGYPRYVERTLAALTAGRLREAELGAASGDALDAQSARALAASLVGLSADEQRALLEVALLATTTGPAPEALFERELVVARGAALALVREADRAPILASLDRDLVQHAYARAARVLAGEREPAALAQAIEYFARADRPRDAGALLAEHRALALRAPRVFAARLAPCADLLGAAERVFVARLLRLAGESARALQQLARARRAGSSLALCSEAVEVYLALGRPRRAERYLERCAELPAEEHAELAARVLVRRGSYARAAELASQALAGELETPERARLLEALALSQAYLVEYAAARENVERAFSLHALDDVRAQARCLSLRGFILLRAGATAEAAAAYARALALAEPSGLVDLGLNALSNLGNARQSLGQWGSALDTYERALRLASALGRAASVRSLRANLANLALELGTFERAESELDALAELPDGDASAALSLSLALYRAELLLLTGEPRRARELLDQILLGAIPQREQVEARVLRLAALLALDVRSALGAARQELPSDTESLPLDLVARVVEVEARALAVEGAARQGIAKLERALERVRSGDDQALLARLETTLAALCRELSASSLASEHEARARARWERIALDLPPTLRDAFWAHPHRAQLARAQGAGVGMVQSGRATLSLSRVRELNRRIGALHQRDQVLVFALDAAIELTGAERGFVLLYQPAGEGAPRSFSVAAAQHMEGARVRKSDWKWSRSIAERVIRQGEPVLTVDAGSDPRFARQASVHAMQLKSVLCAPIRGHSEVLGALYLDNRLARARFVPEDVELLLTFADQVAIALAHAELVLALETKARELVREKRKVEQLARGQASEIERLADELSAHKATLATRYDYQDIVGRSEPMRRVLGVLDRVIDTDLSVLVQGESGTGKELVARALHRNGPRKDKPFVGINCAALPEPLLESELFGHVKGAFTGASSAREGLFVSARGGTLFLDELGELPLSMQAKLLRVLNDGEVRPVGATRSQTVDVRLVCATNQNLKQRVAEGSFREDLYYRVGVVELTLPPLRERHEDIVQIAEAVLRRRAAETGEPVHKLAADAVRALLSHAWPGNVRELQNTLLRATVMATGGVIRSEDLALAPHGTRVRGTAVATTRGEYAQKEAERLLSVLTAERWNVSKVAKSLGIPRNTLYRKLARHGIQREGE